MDDDWILDVLADLKTFAAANDLPFLAVSLSETLRIAQIELASRQAEALRPAGAGPARAVPICVRRGRGSSGPHDA